MMKTTRSENTAGKAVKVKKRRQTGPTVSGARAEASPVIVDNVTPAIACGRHPVKRETGDILEITAEIFRDGHDRLKAAVFFHPMDQGPTDQGKHSGSSQEWPMAVDNPGLDLWRGRVPLDRIGRFTYQVGAWTDSFGSWREEIAKKHEAGQNLANELREGRALVAAALKGAKKGRTARGAMPPSDSGQKTQDKQDKETVLRHLEILDRALETAIAAKGEGPPPFDLLAPLFTDEAAAAMEETADRGDLAVSPPLEVEVDRPRARFAAWYEFFPRSQGKTKEKSGTFDDCILRLPAIREMGFDVLYLPPIHPIGRVHRKGRNNSLTATETDPGSPYAIGGPEGGHTAVHPALGTIDDFDRLVAAAHTQGMEIALDFAIQCAPDHPWVMEHPEWFIFRPDGSIKFAENPPKKYQDIVNVNFRGPHREALWQALCDVILFWVDHGVKIFRVDNPHTKPVPFWEWLIREVRRRHPDVIFLAEAFTRPPMMKKLAKIGFSQSYTYFTWRNFKHELTEYGEELTQTEMVEYFRPNFFTNTPDILPPFLQNGGRPAFMIRLVLAATLSSLYGIYSGFELCENAALPHSEEYLDSEKYQIKPRDWDQPDNIKDYIRRINAIRRAHPALQEMDNLRFYEATNDNVLFYGKMTPDRGDMVFIAVNLDPFDRQEAEIVFPLDQMGISHDETFSVEECLGGEKHLWTGARHHFSFDPRGNPAAIFHVMPWDYVNYRQPDA